MAEAGQRDQQLIQGIAKGDPLILRKIYEQYHKAILHLVETNKGSSEDARDVFQEGILLLYQKSQQANFQLSSSFFTYFYAICRNIWSNKMKKKSFGEGTLTEEMTSMYVEEQVPELEKNEQYVFYRKKFKLLGKDCQALLSLFFQKVKMTEIMTKMNFNSVSYTKKRKFHCKQKLVELIEKDPIYQELKN